MKVSVVYTNLKGHSSGRGHFRMAWWNGRANLKLSILNVLVLTQRFLTFPRWDTPARNTLPCPGWGGCSSLGRVCKARTLSSTPVQVLNAQEKTLAQTQGNVLCQSWNRNTGDSSSHFWAWTMRPSHLWWQWQAAQRDYARELLSLMFLSHLLSAPTTGTTNYL